MTRLVLSGLSKRYGATASSVSSTRFLAMRERVQSLTMPDKGNAWRVSG